MTFPGFHCEETSFWTITISVLTTDLADYSTFRTISFLTTDLANHRTFLTINVLTLDLADYRTFPTRI